MTTYKVPYTKILSKHVHPNAERLEIVKCYDYAVITRKDQYQVGSMVFYVPIDSVLPKDLDNHIFPVDSKIKLEKGRVKQAKIRSFYSQGLLVDPDDVRKILADRGVKTSLKFELEKDYSELLGVKKYVPPMASFQVVDRDKKLRRGSNNPLFHSYQGIENAKWFPNLFTENQEVVVTEKIHGSSCKFAYLPTGADTLFKRVKKLFGLLPKYEYCYGSNNVDLTNKTDFKGYYGEDVYAQALKSCEAHKKIKPNETVYGEIVFSGCQKNYTYGHTKPHFILFDVKIFSDDGSWKWLNPDEVEAYAKERDFDMVPILYKGLYNKALIEEFKTGDSVYCPSQKVREGVVIKSRFAYNNESCSSRKAALKLISEEYLSKNNTDFN